MIPCMGIPRWQMQFLRILDLSVVHGFIEILDFSSIFSGKGALYKVLCRSQLRENSCSQKSLKSKAFNSVHACSVPKFKDNKI